MSIDDTYTLLRSLRHRMAQIFTVDDLRYLRRTGRLSNLEAAVGTVLQIKPLLKGRPAGQDRLLRQAPRPPARHRGHRQAL